MNKLTLFLALTLLITFNTAATHAQDLASLPYADSSWVKPYEPFRIAGDLYYVGTYDLACYFIPNEGGSILINTGLESSVALIKKNIETLGFKFEDIRMLLTTQGHYDHVAGMAEMKELAGALLMVEEGDVPVLEDGGKSDFIFGGKQTFKPVKVDAPLQDGDTIILSKGRLIVHHHPGHTKGATSFIMETADETRTWRVLIANMPSILPETRISGMPLYPKVGEDYGATLAKMKVLGFDLWVASHASQFGLHEKRKEGDPYRPEAFADRTLYDVSLGKIEKQYNKLRKKHK